LEPLAESTISAAEQRKLALRVLPHTQPGLVQTMFPMPLRYIKLIGMEASVIKKLNQIQSTLDGTLHLLRLGRLFSETVLIEVDGEEYYLTFEHGILKNIAEGPSRKTPWRFAFRTDREALEKFWQPVPEPGFHDVFGLVKIGRGRIDGDILCLVKNLRFFKEVLALPRATQEVSK